MTEKAETKFAQLWAAYAQARSQRRDCLSRELAETPEAFAGTDFSDGAGEHAEAHLAVLGAERKALKKLIKHVRKHGSEVMPVLPAVAAPAASGTPRRTSKSAAGAPAAAAPKARKRASTAIKTGAPADPAGSSAKVARPRRAAAKAKPARSRGPAASTPS